MQKLIEINNSIIGEIINIVKQDISSYISNLSLISEEKSKELFLLKRKRGLDSFNPKNNHDIIIKKEKSFSIINISKLEKVNQLNESRNAINEKKSEAFNYQTNNFKKLLNEYSNNLVQEENKNRKFIKDYYKEGNLINNDSKVNNLSAKLKFFNNDKNIINFGTSNEIKVFKNKKMVYINRDLLKNYPISRNIKKLKKINFVKRNKASSNYRGVSRNGSNWQVLIMVNNKRYYIGSYPCEELAARIYDIHAIKNRGIRAKTNFPYNDTQIKNIFEKKINIKCDKISEIMNQINN